MPEQPDKYEPTEADIDMVLEETTGKPIKPKTTAAGITSMRQRIARLEADKTKVLDQLDTAAGKFEADLSADLAKLNKDLAAARERLAHFESQLDQQN